MLNAREIIGTLKGMEEGKLVILESRGIRQLVTAGFDMTGSGMIL